MGTGNSDSNPELFFATRQTPNWSSFTLVQGTNTQDLTVGPRLFTSLQQNPSLSANGSRVAFLSTANLAVNNDDYGNGHGNAEVYVADFTGSGLSNIRQVTRTKTDATAATVNLLGAGRRLSRDGALIAFESLADDPKANSSTNKSTYGTFVYNVSADSLVQVGPRAADTLGDILRFPTFTDYNGLLAPSTLVFASALNFKADGTLPATADASTGLNATNQPQLFATQLPASSSEEPSALPPPRSEPVRLKTIR